MIRARSGRGAGTVLLCLAALLVPAGCSRRATPPAPPSPPATPADPAIAEMAPHLGEWLALWRRVLPGVGADSLRRVASGPFTLNDIHHIDLDDREERARLRVFGVYSPDSTRVVNPDAYLVLTRTETSVSIAGEPDSKPVLIDLKTKSVATLAFCGTDCHYDGAFWLDPLRFALTGSLVVNDSTGVRCGRVLLYDLNAGTMTEYRLPPLADAVAWGPVATAVDSALTARYRAR